MRWERGTRVLLQLHGHSVLIAEGEAWRTRRQALQPAFLPKPVHGFVPAITAPAIPRGAWMPFGAGARVCLGQHMAMTEMTVIAAMFLQRFAVAVPDGMAAPVPALHISLRPAQPLRLQLRARASG